MNKKSKFPKQFTECNSKWAPKNSLWDSIIIVPFSLDLELAKVPPNIFSVAVSWAHRSQRHCCFRVGWDSSALVDLSPRKQLFLTACGYVLGSLSWSQQTPKCLKPAVGLKTQYAWPRPHITVGHPGLQRKAPQSSLLLPSTSCQSTAEAGLKLNIWIECEGECSPSKGYFTQAIRRGPTHRHAELHSTGKQWLHCEISSITCLKTSQIKQLTNYTISNPPLSSHYIHFPTFHICRVGFPFNR
jgi:hypothetical protein